MNAFHNAAKSYKKSDPEGLSLHHGDAVQPLISRVAAVSALHQTIKLLVQAGNFRQAADREKEVSSNPQIPSRALRRVRSGAAWSSQWKRTDEDCRLLVFTRKTVSISQKHETASSALAIGTSRRMRTRELSPHSSLNKSFQRTLLTRN